MTKNQIEYQKLVEQRRSNLANEAIVQNRDERNYAINFNTLQEQVRHNRAYEDETQRHNKAVEANAKYDLGIKERSVVETQRHNVANEQLAIRSQTETERHNLETESAAAVRNLIEGTHNIEMERIYDTQNALRSDEIVSANALRDAQIDRYNRQSFLDEKRLLLDAIESVPSIARNLTEAFKSGLSIATVSASGQKSGLIQTILNKFK